MRRDLYYKIQMITEARHSKDWQQGYDDCAARIQEIIDSMGKESGEGGESGDIDPDELEKELEKALQDEMQNQQNGQDGQKGSQSGDGDDKGDQSKQNQGRGNGSQGVVTPEDCMGPDNLSKVPGTAGGMLDRETGDKIAKEEGYDEGPSDKSVEREWKDTAIKNASKMKGTKFGDMLSEKLDQIYKPTKDWRKELRLIVGQCISPEDKDQRFTNKNILISQSRVSRTDKDKFDTLSYIMAVIDTSGSMTDEMLKKCMSEAYHVALQKKPLNIYIVQCDTKIQDIQKYSSPQQLKKAIVGAKAKGRGGTDFKAVWDLFRNDPRFMRGRCELMMLFTDGYVDQLKRDVRHMSNVLWCIYDNPRFNLEHKDKNTKVIYMSPGME